MFARHYLRNLGWFLFLELLRCFSSLGSPPSPYIFRSGYPCGWVSPFRHVRIKAYLPAPRTFSQAITSFIACNRQGIHHMHLFTWSYNVKTWTLLNIQVLWCMRHPLQVSKALSNLVKNNAVQCFMILQSINIAFTILPILNTSLSSHSVYSLYFFHFVKEQSS